MFERMDCRSESCMAGLLPPAPPGAGAGTGTVVAGVAGAGVLLLSELCLVLPVPVNQSEIRRFCVIQSEISIV